MHLFLPRYALARFNRERHPYRNADIYHYLSLGESGQGVAGVAFVKTACWHNSGYNTALTEFWSVLGAARVSPIFSTTLSRRQAWLTANTEVVYVLLHKAHFFTYTADHGTWDWPQRWYVSWFWLILEGKRKNRTQGSQWGNVHQCRFNQAGIKHFDQHDISYKVLSCYARKKHCDQHDITYKVLTCYARIKGVIPLTMSSIYENIFNRQNYK